MAVLLLGVSSTASGATQRLVYSPFAPDGGVASGLNVVPRAGECFTGSSLAAGAYRCITGNLLRDPCYSEDADVASVICASTPWDSSVVRVALTDTLPEPATSRGIPRAWAVELVAAGRRCRFLTGATAVVRGYRLNYACGRDRYLFGSPRTTSQTWRIRASPNVTGERMKLVTIKRAWR